MPEDRSCLPGLRSQTTRRAVVRTAVWSVPAVSLATAAPAFADSGALVMYADATIYQTPTAWERVVWPETSDDSETTRIENVFVSAMESEQAGRTPVSFRLEILLPDSWPENLGFWIEESGNDSGGPALRFADLAGASTGSGTITGRSIVITGALRQGEVSSVVHVVVDGQGPVEDLVFLLTWAGKTETSMLTMVPWARAEHGRDTPRLLVVDWGVRSFWLHPSEEEFENAGGDLASYPPFTQDARIMLPGMSFPASAPDPDEARNVVVEVSIEHLAPFSGPLEGTLSVAGAGGPGVVDVRLTEPSLPEGVLDFTTSGTTLRWETAVPLTVGNSIGAMSVGLRGAFEPNGALATVRYLVDGKEMETFVLILTPYAQAGA